MSGNKVSIVGSFEDHISGPIDKLRDKFDTLGKSKGAQSILMGVGVGAGVDAFDLLKGAVGGVGDVIRDSISAASDLNETVNKVDVVFGASAKAVNAWGDTTAASMGLSKQAAEEAAASIGNLLLSTGTAPAKIAPMSMSLVKLAGDLASFNNIDPTEALDKLKSGLVGQERPLRELGVAISAASVDTEAAALGFKKLNGTFTEGEKVQARYSLIFKQTATAQGDFARTSDGLANSQRILNAELDDAKAKLGQAAIGWDLMWTKAETGLLNYLGASSGPGETSGIEKSLQGLNAIFGTLGGPLRDVVDSRRRDFGDLGIQMGKFGKNTDDAVAPTFRLGKTLDDLGGRIHQGVPEFQAATGGLTKWTEEAYNAAIAADRAGPKVTDFFNRFDAAVGKGNIAQTKLSLMDDRKAISDIVKEMDKSKPGTAAYKKLQLELAVAQGQLAGDTEALRTEQAKLYLLKPDKSNQAALKKWFDSIGLQVNNLQGDAKDAYDALMRLLGVNVSQKQTLQNQKGGGGGSGKHPKAFAGGGWAGLSGPELAIVGEDEPELIIPKSKMRHGGDNGNPGVVVIPVPSHWSPGEQQKWARDAIKALAPEMRRMGLL